jgi:N-acetylneuraminate synthase
MSGSIHINGREIGGSAPPYVIAEISANHHNDLALVLELVDAIAEAGADAVKLQHFTPDTITVRSDLPEFKISGGTLWDGASLWELYNGAMFPWEWTDAVAQRAAERGLTWFSTPFDESAVEFLTQFETAAYKVASFELIDLPLIRRIAAEGKPIIMSTGMASEDEIDAAVVAARGAGCGELALLRCNSGYPADPSEMDLRTIPVMATRWGVPIGLSDHTLSHTAAVAAVALGACIVEKHVTMRRADGGPDAAFSLEPAELSSLVVAVREAAAAVGDVRFGPSDGEAASLKFRPSLRAVTSIEAGEPITTENVQSVRPAGGLPPEAIGEVIGRVATRSLQVGEALLWSDLTDRDSHD